MPHPHVIVEQTLRNIQADPQFSGLTSVALARLREFIGQALARENEAAMVALWNATSGKEREAMRERFRLLEQWAHHDAQGQWAPANLNTEYWTCWYPGLETDAMLVASVVDTLPGLLAEDVPAIIRAFENPDSPLRLPGACTLEQHDILHVLLGRGLVDQDEAFVLGFTARASAGFSHQDIQRYKVAFSLYPEPYCIRGCDLLAFDLGVEAAGAMPLNKDFVIDVPVLSRQTVQAAREMLGIDKQILHDFYERERELIAGTPWSHRLPRRPG